MIVHNVELLEAAEHKTCSVKSVVRKWRLTGHTVREGEEYIVKHTLEWNRQGARRRGRPKQTWEKTVLEEAEK